MPKKLVQFRFGKKGVEVVDKLKEELDVSSRAEVLRLSLNLLGWVIDCLKNGYEITINRKGGEPEKMLIPFWELRVLTQAKPDIIPRKTQERKQKQLVLRHR